jgi:hypothetical protein
MRSKFKGDTHKYGKNLKPTFFVHDGCEIQFNKQRYIETSEMKAAMET